MLSIRKEIREIEEGFSDRKNNVLKRAPHTQASVCITEWDRPYSREKAAFPISYLTNNKFWPTIGRVNNTYGDRNLVCTCEPVSSYQE
jgi:glycine dehydrogenase